MNSLFFFFSSRRRHTRCSRDWSSDVCSSDLLGLRASETASVVFEDCFVPDENRLGEEGQGFVNAMQILDGGRISIAALAVGIAQGAYESALRYSGERQQFGKPIREFQAIQFKLADMATQIDAP